MTYLTENPSVEHIPVYEQIENKMSLQGEYQGIIATSPHGIEIIARNEALRILPLFVLGETSLKKARDCGFSIVLSCSTPTFDNLTKILWEYFQNKN